MTKDQKIDHIMMLIGYHSDWVCAMNNAVGVEEYNRRFMGKMRTEDAIKSELEQLLEVHDD